MMKKLTAAISAAAIAAAMAVPLTAGAATEDFFYDFATDFTDGNQWTAYTSSSSTDYKALNGAITDDRQLKLDATTSGAIKYIQKSGQEIIGDYTLELDVTLHSATADQFLIMLTADNAAKANYRINPNGGKNGQYVQLNTTNMKYDNGNTAYLTMGNTYHITIEVKADGTYTATTSNAPNGATATLSGSFGENYTKTTAIRIADNAANGGYYLVDNIRLTTTASQPATAKTSKVTAAIEGSVQIGGTEVTGVTNDSIVVGDKYITFYRTDVTKGAKNVGAVTLRPADASEDKAVSVNVDTTADGTASFYSAVINENNNITDWTYDFTYVD